MATLTVDLDNELIPNNTAAMNQVSSDLRSLEIMRLADLTPDQIRLVAGSADFQTLHMRNIEVGGTIKAFHRWFKDHAPLVDAMRNIMRPARGSHKRTKVTIDGVEQDITWGEYCLTVYGVTHDYINRLLKGEHTQDSAEVDSVDAEVAESTEGVEQTVEKKLSAKDQKILDLEKQNDKLQDDINSLNGNLEKAREEFTLKLEDQERAAQCEAQVEEPTHAPVNRTDDPDANGFEVVLNYFQPILAPLSFASELDRIIRACGMQEYVSTVLVEEVEEAQQAD